MATTIKDIAKRLNISISTVSYALNDSGRPVPAELRERVRAVAREMNYRPNRLARSMITGKNNVIGIVPPEMYDNLFLSPYLQLALNGITNEAGHRHQDLLVYTRFSETSGHEVGEAILDGRVDGAIFVSPYVGQNAVLSVANAGLPCVTMAGIPQGGVVNLGIDNEGGMSKIVRHLIDLGHTRIAHITGLLTMEDALLRLKGYQETLYRQKLRVRDEYVVRGRFEIDGGYRAMKELLDLPVPPTAVCCANDEMAIGAIQAASEAGLKVPEDISISGFDMTPTSATVNPPITTVRQPITKLGTLAVQCLLRLVDGDKDVEDIVLDTEFIERGSTAPPRRTP